MKATFCFSKMMPSRIARIASTSTVRRDTRSSAAESAAPLRKTVA